MCDNPSNTEVINIPGASRLPVGSATGFDKARQQIDCSGRINLVGMSLLSRMVARQRISRGFSCGFSRLRGGKLAMLDWDAF
jgi:hypothetical protein